MNFKTKGEIQVQKAKAKKHFLALCQSQVRHTDFGGYTVCIKRKSAPIFFKKAEDMVKQFPDISPDLKASPDNIFVFECSLTGVFIKFIC